MPLRFEDNILNQNTNYTVVSALENHVRGIYWVANTTERDAIGDANIDNNDRRAQYVVVFVASTPYIYTSSSIADVDWEDAANWTEIGTGGGSTTTISTFVDTDVAEAITSFADSFDSAEFVYKLKDSTNGYIRSGRLYVTHDGTDANVSDVSTKPLGGDTTLPSFSATVTGGTVTVFASDADGYTFTATATYL